jgi:hypothetical protein
MEAQFVRRLNAINWPNYQTAYGPATKVPGQLVRLASKYEKEAIAASHDLWCGLCHQHAYISSASLPALPFILNVLDRANAELSIEILDILLGFASCTVAESEINRPVWVGELRERLREELPRFKHLAGHANKDIADFSQRIIEVLVHSGADQPGSA